MNKIAITLPVALLPLAAAAEAPVVVTDIAPVHSLVARVMEGVGTPGLLLPPTASPHDFALRPSDAEKLSQAGLVVWVGEKLSPILEDPIEDLATNAVHLELLETDGWPMRMFPEGHDDDHEEGHSHDAHAEEAEEHGHEHEHEHEHEDDHDHATGESHDHDDGHGHHDHNHSGLDPHAWLDPVVASAWTIAIADALASVDPDNAEIYATNADEAQKELTELRARIEERLAGVSGKFVVPHDAYGYFTDRFGLPAAGTIALHDAQDPGPARIAALKAEVAEGGVDCVLTDPQVSARWTTLLREGTHAGTARVDPIGGDFDLGPAHYGQTMEAIADAIATCLGR